jgi:hypothetical protein
VTTVVNLRDFGAAGVAPRPWGPFDLPPDVVRIDRGTPWGNPYRIGEPRGGMGIGDITADQEPMTREDAIARYRTVLKQRLVVEPTFLEPLRGKRLACWCAPLPCHGDVIAEILDTVSA